MPRPLIKILHYLFGSFLLAAGFPNTLRAQLVRENYVPPAQQEKNTAAQVSSGKQRLSQEIQLTGEETWLDTGIDIQAGEHVLITATGTLRYANAKSDNGPDGLARGFKDLIRILPFNEAGRGALMGRIGEKETAQPFPIGARC